jgi:hypothetical protein
MTMTLFRRRHPDLSDLPDAAVRTLMVYQWWWLSVRVSVMWRAILGKRLWRLANR